MTFRLEHPEFHASVADLRGACAAIATARARATGQVGLLLGGGWSGRAAASFAEAWADWERAAAVVSEELTRLSDVLAEVHAGAIVADQTAADALARVAGRLG